MFEREKFYGICDIQCTFVNSRPGCYGCRARGGLHIDNYGKDTGALAQGLVSVAKAPRKLHSGLFATTKLSAGLSLPFLFIRRIDGRRVHAFFSFSADLVRGGPADSLLVIRLLFHAGIPDGRPAKLRAQALHPDRFARL